MSTVLAYTGHEGFARLNDNYR